MPPPLGGSSGGLPSRVEYLSPQGVLLPLVYGTTASPLWLELRGHSAWQVTPSWTVYRLACHRLLHKEKAPSRLLDKRFDCHKNERLSI